jgi:threonylcarbamoyladenosine tRNA methylthiotransferase MtaB
MYINLSEKKLRAFYEKHLGTWQTVLFEEQIKKDKLVGFTENYIKVETHHNEDLVNQTEKVTLKSILPNGNVLIEFAK